MFGHRLKATFDEANKRNRANKDVWGLLLEMQQRTTHGLISYIYHLFTVHSQSIVRCAFAAFGSSSAIFLCALIASITVLSIKGTCTKSVKVRRCGGSLQITTLKHTINMFNDA